MLFCKVSKCVYSSPSKLRNVRSCTKDVEVYIRLTHLVGELTTYKGGTKPQRLLNEGASHTIECMCIAHGEVIYAILT